MTLYKLYETIKGLSISGWFTIFIIISLFVEIVPFKVNPIGWLGDRLNAPMYKKVAKIESKLDEHIAQSYRNKILAFQDLLLSQSYTEFTKEQYDEVIEAIHVGVAFLSTFAQQLFVYKKGTGVISQSLLFF